MAFDQDKPAANTSLRVSNPQILDNQEQLQIAVDNEHIFSGTDAGTQTGDHTQGSARCFFTDTAPSTRIDGNNFIETDNGSLWIDTDDNAFYMLTDYSQAVAADKWTPISDEVISILLANPRVFLDTLSVTGAFAVNTDKFTVDAVTGNTVAEGTVEAKTSLDINSTVVVVGTIDDDTMGAASDTSIATSESIKAYVDDSLQIIARVRFDSSGNILDDYNVSSITKTGVGEYRINIGNNASDANYAISATPIGDNFNATTPAGDILTTSFKVRTWAPGGGLADNGCSAVAYGNLA